MTYNKMRPRDLIMPILLLCVFTACFPTGENPTDPSAYSVPLGDLNTSSNENIIYSFTIPTLYSASYPYVFIKRKTIDADTAFHTLCGDTAEVVNRECNRSNWIPDENLLNIWTLTDNSDFVYDAGWIMYFGVNAETHGYTTFDSSYEINYTAENVRREYPKSELETFSSEKYVEKMRNIIDKLSLYANSTPEIYALDEKVYTDHWSQNEWDENSYGYMIVFSTEYNGLKLPDFNISFPENSTNSSGRFSDWQGSRITGVFTEKGLEFFTCAYIPEIVDEYGEAQVCTPEAAITAVKERYESMSLNDEYKYIVSGCELMYLPYPKDDGYLLTPAWFFTVETQIPERKSSRYDFVFVNAVTGMIGDVK